MKKNSEIFLSSFLFTILYFSITSAANYSEAKPDVPPDIERITFIDYSMPTHFGNKCDDSIETDKFSFIQRKAKWTSFPVTYKFDSSVQASFQSAITNGFEEWDFHEPLGINFYEFSSTTGNVIYFAPIDGEGNIVAIAHIFYNTKTKAFTEFSITFDSNDPWGIGSDTTFHDVQNVAAHEAGHATGLGHVNSPNDCMLTMFKYVQKGEIAKRDLGLGDKLGVQKLYG